MWRVIFKTALLAGTLDIIAAFIQSYLTNNTTPSRVLQFVASGVFSTSAFTGSTVMLVWGLFFHFSIAFSCTACFFLVYPKIKVLSASWILNAVAIGIVAWCVTNLIIVPLSNTPKSPFNILKVPMGLSILIVCIGMPIAYYAKLFFQEKSKK
ncbi:MAG TPA: hypothetical protein PLJ60_11550 [Chryseolinea sp.]|nr:hypothetical protein [Chryseolinea sp.]